MGYREYWRLLGVSWEDWCENYIFAWRGYGKRFGFTNKDKKLKPFNFVIVGIGYKLDPSTKEPIIPLLAYTKKQISCHLVRLLITKLAKSTKRTPNITGNRFQNSSLSTWIIMITSMMAISESYEGNKSLLGLDFLSQITHISLRNSYCFCLLWR